MFIFLFLSQFVFGARGKNTKNIRDFTGSIARKRSRNNKTNKLRK
jgi:hypothetical protein